MLKIKMAASMDFFKAYSDLPKQQQQKVQRFLDDFKKNPTASGYNYENIHSAADPHLRSVRIDGNYRAIVLKPKEGNVYCLLWVDTHDKAYQWAKSKRILVHPEVGSIQILDVSQSEEIATEKTREKSLPSLFEAFPAKDLIRLGIPEEILPRVYELKAEGELDQLSPSLPGEAAEALYMLASGYSLEEAYTELQTRTESDPPVDPEDFEAALKHPDTLRRFVIISDDSDLESVLEASLEKWRVFLHPSQRRIVELDIQGPIRVLGGAGTGKTVVALHRAKRLAENLNAPHERILFTTFTKNLATDIQSNLRKICDPEIMKKIDVINLDALVSQFLQKQGYEYKLSYQSQDSDLLNSCWDLAMDKAPPELALSLGFYQEEWAQIVLAKGIRSENDYLKVARMGRGTALNRMQRKKIWPVFHEFRLQLREKGYKEVEDAYWDAREILLEKPHILPYSHILLDEAQDMGEQALKLIRAMLSPGRNDIFIVGDAHQRIYRHKLVLSQCGINIQGKNHSFKLKINYRTTDEIRKWATHLLENRSIDDLDDGVDTQKGYRSLMHGAKPEVRVYKSFDQEIEAIVSTLEDLQKVFPLNHMCLTLRDRNQLKNYGNALEKQGIPIRVIQTQQADKENEPGLRLATMHRVKGLEFDAVLIAGASEGIIPPSHVIQQCADAIDLENTETRERSLLYVAATRAKQKLFISAFGKLSPFLNSLV